jgi:hypothetical protein
MRFSLPDNWLPIWGSVHLLRKWPLVCAECKFSAVRTYCQYLFSCEKWQLISSPINLWTKLLTKVNNVCFAAQTVYLAVRCADELRVVSGM